MPAASRPDRPHGDPPPGDDLAARLAPLAVLDTAGQEVTLASLWQQQPRVLALLRHFG
jgi:hypothetical protein